MEGLYQGKSSGQGSSGILFVFLIKFWFGVFKGWSRGEQIRGFRLRKTYPQSTSSSPCCYGLVGILCVPGRSVSLESLVDHRFVWSLTSVLIPCPQCFYWESFRTLLRTAIVIRCESFSLLRNFSLCVHSENTLPTPSFRLLSLTSLFGSFHTWPSFAYFLRDGVPVDVCLFL